MRERRSLVLFPLPYQGHITPMLQLATALHEKGFSITIIHTNYNAPNPQNHPDFTFISIPDNLSDHEILSGNLPAIILSLNANCIGPLDDCLARILQDGDLGCIIYDEFMYLCEDVAKRLDLHSIMFRTHGAATFLAREWVLRLIDGGLVPLPDSMMQDMVAEQYPLRYKDLPLTNSMTISEFVDAVNNSRDFKSSKAVIWNTIDCLEGNELAQVKQKEGHVPIFAVGPVHKLALTTSSSSLLEEDSGCVTWLDKQVENSVIYISFGSVASIGVDEFVEMAYGIANSKQPFLWVVRPGLVSGTTWIESLPNGFHELVDKSGLIVKWAPQMEVLKHKAIGGFFTHCGWNSMMESLCEGVPMICRPSFGDQKVNARYVSCVWRVGLQLECEGREEVEKVIRRLMVETEGEGIREKAMEFKEKIENCLKEGGFSHDSLEDLANFIMSFLFA